MRSKRVSVRLQAVGWLIVSAMTASAMDGMLCGSRPQDDRAMQCCRKDASPHLDAPKTQGDCCKPSRSGDVLPELLAANRNQNGQKNTASGSLPVVRLVSTLSGSEAPSPMAQGFPDFHSHPPRVVPLLI